MKILVPVKLTDQQRDSLLEVSPDIQLVLERDPEKARSELRNAEILFTFRIPGPLEEAGSLRWIQLNSAGADHVLNAGARDRDILVTTVSGIHAIPISEFVLWAMISLARRMRLVSAEMERKQWRPSRPRTYAGGELHGKTLGVLGLGSIGRRIATVGFCLGMRVLGLSRSGAQLPPEAGVERVFRTGQLLEMLPLCDFVVAILPLTAETRGLLGEPELRAMKPTACLINVARGQVVREEALVTALREGWIAGAALDVFEQEPLPADSPLWEIQNAVITPHVAGDSSLYMDRATKIFRDNLRRFLAGEPMINVVDKARGY